jgi:hypothetical protein
MRLGSARPQTLPGDLPAGQAAPDGHALPLRVDVVTWRNPLAWPVLWLDRWARSPTSASPGLA